MQALGSAGVGHQERPVAAPAGPGKPACIAQPARGVQDAVGQLECTYGMGSAHMLHRRAWYLQLHTCWPLAAQGMPCQLIQKVVPMPLSPSDIHGMMELSTALQVQDSVADEGGNAPSHCLVTGATRAELEVRLMQLLPWQLLDGQAVWPSGRRSLCQGRQVPSPTSACCPF